MRAARMYGYNQPLVLEDVDTPEIAANEVLVKVEAAGMCRTDVRPSPVQVPYSSGPQIQDNC